LITIPRNGDLYKLNTEEFKGLEALGRRLFEAIDPRPADRKAVFIKAPRTLPYGEVVKVIDVVKQSGGQPIGLQIEDLEQ
jgi:biopolymer transport protein ExbD